MNGRERTSTSSSSSALSLSSASSPGDRESSPENEVESEEVEKEEGGGCVFDDGVETQALLIASVESRLQHIPDSCEKYKPTLSAIETLQGLISELREGTGSLILASLATELNQKQEILFQALVHFHSIEIERHKQFLDKAEQLLQENPVTKSYVEEQILREKLNDTRESLTSCDQELRTLLEAPHPVLLSLDDQQLKEGSPFSPSDTSTVYSNFKRGQNTIQMLLLSCHKITENFDSCLQDIGRTLESKKEHFLKDLAEVESWLNTAYCLLCLEPVRDTREMFSEEGGASEEEGEEEEEGVVMEEMDGEGSDEGAKLPVDLERLLYDSSEEQGSDLSLGSGDMIMGEGDSPSHLQAMLDTSVDVDLADDEYSKEVLDRVISPYDDNDDGEGMEEGEMHNHFQNGFDVDGTLQQIQTTAQAELFPGISQDGSGTLQSEDGESVSSESTLRSEMPQTGALPPCTHSPSTAEFEPEQTEQEFDAQQVKSEEEPSEVDGETAVVDGRKEEERENEEEDKQQEEEEEGGGEEGSGEGEEGSGDGEEGSGEEEEGSGEGEEGSGKGEEGSSEEEDWDAGASLSEEERDEFEWVRKLALLPLYSPSVYWEELGMDQSDYIPPIDDACIETVIEELEKTSSQVSTMSHKLRGTRANIGFVQTDASQEVANQLQLRLERLMRLWEPLDDRLRHRTAQLHYEKVQKEMLESMQEAVDELEQQPKFNVLPEMIEKHRSTLMEFFISLESFETQCSSAMTELDEVMQPLLEFPFDSRQDLSEVGESMQQGYDVIAERLKYHIEFLDHCDTLWLEYEEQKKVFEEWLSPAEEVVYKEKYGYTGDEIEKYMAEIKKLKAQVPSEEKKVEKLVELGQKVMESAEKGEEAELFVDTQLQEWTTRWHELVVSLDERESCVHNAIIHWQGFTKIFQAVQAFSVQMRAIVGSEPLESSNGDRTLLPTYKTYASQVKAMDVNFRNMETHAAELGKDPGVGWVDSIKEEMRVIRNQWEPLKDNVNDSLDILVREYDEWVRQKLSQMDSLIQQGSAIVTREIEFVQAFPIGSLLSVDATALLKEADLLVANQNQLSELEENCSQIEEQILDCQIQQETAGHPASELESEATKSQRRKVQEGRLGVQATADVLGSVMNVFYLQLQLCQQIQEGQDLVTKALNFIGGQAEVESQLVALEVQLSNTHFEQLRSNAYDLGIIVEEFEAIADDEEQSFALPSFQKVMDAHQALASEIDALHDGANEAREHLHLIKSWWAEYSSCYDELFPWVMEAKARLEQLRARAESTQAPRVSPMELLADAKELEGELTERDVKFNALVSSGKDILNKMAAMNCEPTAADIGRKLPEIEEYWEELKLRLSTEMEQLSETVTGFNQFLTSLTAFMNWLSQFRSSLIDESCVQIPSRASSETYALHQHRLQEFHSKFETHEPQLTTLKETSCEWMDHLVPEDLLSDLTSEDSGHSSADEDVDAGFEPLLPYVRAKMKLAEEKWREVQQRLRDRQNQLEMCMGNMVVFQEQAEEFLAWAHGHLQLPAISALLPADLSELNACLETTQEVSRALRHWEQTKCELERSAESLKLTLSETNVKKVEQKLAEINQRWNDLNDIVTKRMAEAKPMLKAVEKFWEIAGNFEEWLIERERRMEECGSIGTDEKRLVEQAEILEAIDEETLGKKPVPEEVYTEALEIIKLCLEGSGTAIQEKAHELQERFDALSQKIEEQKELCEEATAAMQQFRSPYDRFCVWLGVEEGKLVDIQNTRKEKPIGNIQCEIEDFLDYMQEIEQQNELYTEVYCLGKSIASKYKPSDTLDTIMSELQQRWDGYVGHMVGHLDRLLELRTMWKKYEGEVKDLLEWITTEAENFSKEVTTYAEKGIEDHIESCKVFSETLEGKKVSVDDIQEQADVLQAEDGRKKNGTSDVESRLNDVEMHWNSCCKLLAESLVRLEATYAELRHILLIRDEEFNWLEGCEEAGRLRRAARGDLDIVRGEINVHNQLLEEVQSHENEAEFILQTVPFLQEHSRISEREGMKLKAENFSQRYRALLHSEEVYVTNLQKSIPVWQEFNERSQELRQFLEQAHMKLDSEHFQPGSMVVTESSLANATMLQNEVQNHNDLMLQLQSTVSALGDLCVADDQEFVSLNFDTVQCGSEEVSNRTDERVDLLEQRMKSWSVFPVEEAKVVQAFLEQVSEEVGGEEEEEEEMSAEELLMKLEKLEELQAMQTSNEDKVSTIHQSTDDEEVRKALEKNPDISKERSNLLQGWSNVSTSLNQRIQMMKRKAKMLQELERVLNTCQDATAEYRACVYASLPPSTILETTHQKMRDDIAHCHDSSQTCLTRLKNVLDQYAADPDIDPPPRLQQQAMTTEAEFGELGEKADDQLSTIDSTLSSWAEFQANLKDLSECLRRGHSELNQLQRVGSFAMEFSSLETRLQLLSEDIEMKKGILEGLSALSQRHLFGEDASVTQYQVSVQNIEKSWKLLDEELKELGEAIQPWKDLTDYHDRLSEWFEEFEAQVDQDLAATEGMEDTAAGADLSDSIVLIKDHLLKLNQQIPELQKLERAAEDVLGEEVCAEFRASGELRVNCETMVERQQQLTEKLKHALEEVEKMSAAWKARAVTSMYEVVAMRQKVVDMETLLAEQREHIYQLEQSLKSPPRSASHNSICPPISLCILLPLFFLLLALAFIVFPLVVDMMQSSCSAGLWKPL